jgi:hypothetical protein
MEVAMSIISKLKNVGIEVRKTDRFYRGYVVTANGVKVSHQANTCDNGIYFLDRGDGKVFPCNDRTLFIATGTEYEGKIQSKEDAELLASEGKIYSFKSSDLYAEYYDFEHDKELEAVFRYGYSTRSRKYIEDTMKNIGLLSYTHASNGSRCEEGNPSVFETIRNAQIYINADTEIGKIGDNTWIAQTCHQIDIDDFAVMKMYFDHAPTNDDLRIAFYVEKFEMKPIEVYKCWECGRLTHWLDNDGDIRKKYDMAVDQYCGC